jgi:hypothetical protein
MMLSCRSKTGSIALWRAGLGKIPAKTRQSRGNQQPANDFPPRPFPVPGYDQPGLMGIGKAEAIVIWGSLVTLPCCRKKPARHPPQDSTNGPFKSDEPWNPESSELWSASVEKSESAGIGGVSDWDSSMHNVRSFKTLNDRSYLSSGYFKSSWAVIFECSYYFLTF